VYLTDQQAKLRGFLFVGVNVVVDVVVHVDVNGF
jgi:hypothetical protein